MRCAIHQNIAKSRGKALRLPEDHQRRVAFEGVCRSRLKRRGLKQKIFVKNQVNTIVPIWNFLLFNHGKKGLGKFSIFPAYREGTTMQTQLEQLQRNQPLKLVLTLMSTPTAYCMEERVLWSPGESQLLLRLYNGEVPFSLVCTRKETWRKRYADYKRVCHTILQWQCSQTPNLYVPLCLESLRAQTPSDSSLKDSEDKSQYDGF